MASLTHIEISNKVITQPCQLCLNQGPLGT